MEEIKNFKTVNEVEEYRKQVNEACDNRVKFITRCEEADELSKKQFAYLKEAFEAISPKLFNLAEGKKIINKYTKEVRNNKNLSLMHYLCENIRKANKNSDVDFFINSIADKKWVTNSETLDEDVKVLGRIVAEGYLLVGEKADLPKEDNAFISSVSYIAENQKSQKNIAEFSDAVKIIREHIESNDSKPNMFESKNLDEIAKDLLEGFNKKYSKELNEEEKNVLKSLLKSDDKETIFNDYKTKCINKITETKNRFDSEGDSASSNRLSTILERVNDKSYNPETIGNDICSLIELTSVF